MKKVLYIGNFDFPEKDAACQRVIGIGKILRDLNYEVNYCGINLKCREQDLQKNGEYYFEGFRYFFRDDLKKNKIQRTLNYYFKINYIIELVNNIGENNIEIIIGYHLPAVVLLKLERFCKVKKIKLISDCTEWYQAKQISRGIFGLGYLNSQLRMYYSNFKIKNLIVISEYLEKYYSNINTVKIPPVLDIDDEKWNIEKHKYKSKVRKYCYFGSPGKKDLIKNIINSFESLDKENEKFSLDIIGVTEKQYRDNYDKNYPSYKNIKFFGRVEHKKALEIVGNADFSLVIRKVERCSKAGFPTKFVESMQLKVPIICNLTSDLNNYLKNGKNGFICKDFSINEITHSIKKSLKLSEKELEIMKKEAYKCSVENFYYKNYNNIMKEFIKKIM